MKSRRKQNPLPAVLVGLEQRSRAAIRLFERGAIDCAADLAAGGAVAIGAAMECR